MTVLEGVVIRSALRNVRRANKLGIAASIVRKGLSIQSRRLSFLFTVLDISYSDWQEHKKVCKLKLDGFKD
jgi:hypothetical protein